MKLKAKLVDDKTNRDMVLLFNSKGWCIALCHMDSFHEDEAIRRDLDAGLEVTLDVRLAKEEGDE